MSIYIGITCCIAFIGSMIYIIYEKYRKSSIDQNNTKNKIVKEIPSNIENETITTNIYLKESAI